jgi:DNA topoisomerase-2
MARLAFPAADDAVLNYLDDDGTPVEPEYYVPIVPFVLINGDVGIGTGFSTTIPAHNPAEVAGWCLRMVEALDKAKVVVEKKGDLPDANAVVEKCALPAIRPYYHGFTGTIEEVDAKEGTYVSRGVWRWLSDTQLEVTELPIGTWTETFKDLLTEMLQNNHPLLKDYKNYYTDKKVHFVLIFHAGKRAEVTDKVLETEFKLASQKNLSYNNIHLYNPEGAIAKYKSAAHIAREFAKKRLGMYLVRKKAELDRMEAEFKVVSAKVRFIQDVVEGRIVVMNRKERELSAQLAEMGYPKMAGAGEKADVGGAKAADGEEDADDVEAEEPDAGTANVPGAGYGYLTGMPIRQLTRERKLALEAQAAKMQALIDELRATAIHHIWKRELEAFLDGWTKMAEEKAVMNTDKEPVPAKKAAAKKK